MMRSTELFSCLFEIFKIALHPGSAVLLHALRHMAVHIKGKSGGSVAQVALDSFHVVPILEGEDGKGMPEIVEPNLGQSCPLQHPVKHIQYAVW